MKIKLRGVKRVCIDGDFIRLDDLLKFASMVSSGGEAKVLIQGGEVWVDGELCVSRGKKIRSGAVVRCGENTLVVNNQGPRAII